MLFIRVRKFPPPPNFLSVFILKDFGFGQMFSQCLLRWPRVFYFLFYWYDVLLFGHSVVSDSATPWTVACQAPWSMDLPRQEYWSGLPFPAPNGILHQFILNVKSNLDSWDKSYLVMACSPFLCVAGFGYLLFRTGILCPYSWETLDCFSRFSCFLMMSFLVLISG